MELPSIQKLKEALTNLESQMSEAAAGGGRGRLTELSQQHAEKAGLLTLIEQARALETQEAEIQSLLEGDDEEMRKLAEDDAGRVRRELAAVRAEIERLLLPRDPRDERDVIVEIRAGAGGDEAGLFAAQLLRAYTRYAELHGWQVHIVSSSQNEQGGYKEVVAEVAGKNVFGTLKFERGVHRVQRVPDTEKQGRIHTSTVTVAVLPQAEEVDIEVKTEELRIDTYRASGAGGQHVNKTDSAIRITHIPTNTVVAVQDERSQHKNKAKAMRILRSRLLEAQEEEQQKQEASDRKAQVGTGDRSEKIRTYNFPQDRITDHRIKQSWGNIEGVMEGQMERIFGALADADRELRLANAE